MPLRACWGCPLPYDTAHVSGALSGAATTAMVVLGDELGLYRALADAGPVTPAELATKTRTHERYVREWLAQQAAAGRPAGCFCLPSS